MSVFLNFKIKTRFFGNPIIYLMRFVFCVTILQDMQF